MFFSQHSLTNKNIIDLEKLTYQGKSFIIFCCSYQHAEAEDMKRFREDVLVDHADQLKEVRDLLNQQTVKAEINSLQRK